MREILKYKKFVWFEYPFGLFVKKVWEMPQIEK